MNNPYRANTQFCLSKKSIDRATWLPSIEVDGRTFRVDTAGLLTPYRRVLIEPAPPEAQIRNAVRFLRAVGHVKTPKVGGNFAKHFAEHWVGSYISRGALYIAAYRCGVPLAVDDGGVTIGVSKRGLQLLKKSTPSLRSFYW